MKIDYKKWVEDLESGEYTQTDSFGCDNKRCVLGCLYQSQFRDKELISHTQAFYVFLRDNNLMEEDDFDELLVLNDGGMKFPELAKFIREKYVKT